MADLAKALPALLKHEGGYVDDPDDAGQATYRGIARRYHPSWGGWEIIDAWRRAGSPIVDTILYGLVERFYRIEFWDRFQGDKIQSQAVADWLLNFAVHAGVHRAVETLQRALNVLNNQGRLWPDMIRDGKLGPATLRALLAAFVAFRGDELVTVLKGLQVAYYVERMEQRAVNEKYAGWFDRVSPSASA
jgi:lysozyme family protein